MFCDANIVVATLFRSTGIVHTPTVVREGSGHFEFFLGYHQECRTPEDGDQKSDRAKEHVLSHVVCSSLRRSWSYMVRLRFSRVSWFTHMRPVDRAGAFRS